MDASSNSTNHPSRLEHLIAATITLLILEQHSRFPEAKFYIGATATLTAFGLAIAYCIRLAKRSRWQTALIDVSPRAIWNWLVFPIAVALMLTSAESHWPASIRLHLSKSSFDELVSQAHDGQELQGFPRRVGLYWIENVKDSYFDYQTGQGKIGFVTGVALFDECGLYYDESDRKSSHYLTTRIASGWYITEW